MTNFEDANLEQAALNYAVANTPLFLLRKVREDPVTREIADSFSGQAILAELRSSVDRSPENLLDYVRPYVYLVALSMKPEDVHLRAAARLPNIEKWNWLSYLQGVLLETYTPTESAVINLQPKMQQYYVTGRMDAPVVFSGERA